MAAAATAQRMALREARPIIQFPKREALTTSSAPAPEDVPYTTKFEVEEYEQHSFHADGHELLIYAAKGMGDGDIFQRLIDCYRPA